MGARNKSLPSGTMQEKKPKAPRNAKGQFVKGASGNPTGRAKLPEDIREMCKALTPQAIETAKRIMLNDEAKDADRLRAAEIILDRAWGKPAQSVALDTGEGARFVFVGMNDVAD